MPVCWRIGGTSPPEWLRSPNDAPAAPSVRWTSFSRVRTLKRPDDIDIRWKARGSGPAVLIVHQLLWSYPQVYAELIGELASDHRVVTYDPRGCGSSTRRGPYDTETDTGDLEAVAEEAGAPAGARAVGYGDNHAVRVAARRPDQI